MTQAPVLPPPKPRPADAPVALDSIRVIDFTHFVAGPMCTEILGDFGAQVIKIERPDRGDDYRSGQPRVAGEAAPFVWVNRNKQSVGLDLSKPEGRAVARALIAEADILVENFSPGVMDRLGLGYETLARDFPRLIYCSISGAGHDGPLAHRPSFDPIAQAESGFISVTGEPDGPGFATGSPVMDMTTGMMASNMVLAALFAREKLGRGQHVRMAMLDQAVNMLGFRAMNFLATGAPQPRTGTMSRQSVPTGRFPTADQDIYLCCPSQVTYERLVVKVFGRPDLFQREEFATPDARARHADALIAELCALLRTDTREGWLEKMRAASVPCAPIREIHEALTSDEILGRGILSSVPHPAGGTVPNIAHPFDMGLTPTVTPQAAPMLGQHTEPVLRQVLGYDEARLAQLREVGAIR